MKGFVCGVCGYVAINGEAPEHCPVCYAPKTSFKLNENAVKTEQDEITLSEKHTPVIIAKESCSLIPNESTPVSVRIGKTIHPMEKEHFITVIDAYLNNNFLARLHLTPENMNPATRLYLKNKSGKISIIAHCNKHGNWIKELEL